MPLKICGAGTTMALDLKGCGTALITPFNLDGSLDLPALENLVDWQIREGIHFLVPCGTTGESVTLTHDEYLTVVRDRRGQSCRPRSCDRRRRG